MKTAWQGLTENRCELLRDALQAMVVLLVLMVCVVWVGLWMWNVLVSVVLQRVLA